MTSDQISAMAGNFQAQTMGQMQHAAMISQQVGHQPFAERAMGGLTNAGAAVGSPLLSAGMGLAGLDPFSMGIRGAMMGSRFGGLGMVGGGLAGAGLVAAPMMAAQYAGSQMLTGMQQQQQLNSTLRNTYQFAGPTGRGFSASQMGGIGDTMRQMSMQQGPGGEFATMGELTRMAGMMGQMGMGQGIRNARDFTEKFRNMMKEVKQVAEAFHTSLEEAQQVVGQMRSSGIFRNQGQVAQQIRGTALAGGLATSEVTAMMNIGSQISRSVGGRGQAGAMGGMKTIGTIGTALQQGVLSEEDIYNATGLTGAEGRQAMAMSSMSRSARFLKGGLGRRMLASMAGANGTIDEAAADDYLYGGAVGTGETMGMAGRHLGKVGRANFIRNEGRMRGAVLEKFGGNADVLVMKQWLEQRGMDTDSDRARIFMSRRLGIGAEELDEQMKIVNNMPQLMRAQEMAGNREARLGRIEHMRAHTGIEGVKRKFEKFRNDMNSKLQQAGADFYKEGANVIERWANELTDNFATEMSENLEPAIQEVLRGGGGAERLLAERFGMGRGLVGQSLTKSFQRQAFGAPQRMGAMEAGRQAGDIDRMRAAGFNITAGNDAQYAKQMKAIQAIGSSFREGNTAVAGLGRANAGDLRTQLLFGGLDGGMQGQTQFGNYLEKSQDPRLQMLSLQYGQANAQQRAGIMGTVMREAGVGGLGAGSQIAPQEKAIFNMGGFRTTADRNMALGQYMLGAAGQGDDARRQAVEGRGKILGAGLRGGLAVATGGLSEWFGFGKSVQDWGKGQYREAAGGVSNKVMEAAGDYMMSEKGQKTLRGILSRDEATAGKAQEAAENRAFALMQRQQELSREGGALGATEQGELEGLKSTIIARQFAKLSEEFGEDIAAKKISEEMSSKGVKMSMEEVKRRGGGALASLGRDQDNARAEMIQRTQEHGAARSNMFRAAGWLEGGKMTAAAIGKFGSIGKAKQVTYGEGHETNTRLAEIAGWDAGRLKAGLGPGGTGKVAMTSAQKWLAAKIGSAQALERMNQYAADDPKNAELLQEHLELSRAATGELAQTSDVELQRTAAAMREGGDLGSAREISEQRGLRQRLRRAGGGARGQTIFAEALGSKISRRELMAMKTPEAMATALGQEMLGSQFSTKDDTQGGEFYKDLKEALQMQKSGKTEQAAAKLQDLRQRASSMQEKQAEDKKKEDSSYKELAKIAGSMKELPTTMKNAFNGSTVKIDGTVTVKDADD